MEFGRSSLAAIVTAAAFSTGAAQASTLLFSYSRERRHRLLFRTIVQSDADLLLSWRVDPGPGVGLDGEYRTLQLNRLVERDG